jgi:hypothetical protein
LSHRQPASKSKVPRKNFEPIYDGGAKPSGYAVALD